MRSIRHILSCALLALVILAVPAPSSAQVAAAILVAPPALPVYEQPVCVGPGYFWTPGYWAWVDDDYYWVPGTWVLAPVGLLWTPGYWAWSDGGFIWNAGYWGREVGFYGGVVYGFGYVGVGYQGGYWNNGALYYNRSVNNITNVTTITTVYNRTVVNNVTVNNVSYNGGVGGTTARPTAAEQAAAGQPHTPPTEAQIQHQHVAGSNRELFASQNHGKPPIAATPKPTQFSVQGVVAAKAAAPYHPTPAPGGARPDKPAPSETVKPAQPPKHATSPPAMNKANPNEAPKPVQPPPPKPRPETPPAQSSRPPSEQSKKPEPPPQEKQKEQEKAKEKPKPPQPPQN
jgi:hypothetical protein